MKAFIHCFDENSMVKEIDGIFKCEICGLRYKERRWAEKCEEWCREHPDSCNVEAASHSIRE